MIPLSHAELCKRALRWLRGTKRCNPAFSGPASCSEIPDAIGWSSAGSIVVECKTSILDFYADEQKYVRYKSPDGYVFNGRGRSREFLAANYERIISPNMGDFRYFMCEPGIIEKKHMEKYPGHGLLHVIKNRVKVILEAEQRPSPDLLAERRYLRFVVVNGYCHANCRQLIESISSYDARED